MREFPFGTAIDGGKYVLLQLIGRGGMGVVYRAQQVRLGRDVAIKFVDCDPERDQRLIQRFQLEARTLATLDHPSVLDVHDVGEFEGYPYLVMDFVEGGPLESPAGYPLDLRTVASVLNDIAAALDYLHARGVVHRDLKPSNILMGRGGRAILSDFGVIKVIGANFTSIESRAPSTPLYQSPEQIAGSEVTPLSDIYSLGVVVYHLTTGYPPFQGPTRQTIEQRHMAGVRAVPRGLNPDLPEAADAAILKAMALEPAARYQSAGEFARDFANAVLTPAAGDVSRQTLVLPDAPDRQPAAARQEVTDPRQTVVLPDVPAGPETVILSPSPAVGAAVASPPSRQGGSSVRWAVFVICGLAAGVFAVAVFLLIREGSDSRGAVAGISAEDTPIAARGLIGASAVPEIALRTPTPLPPGASQPSGQSRERLIDQVVIIKSDTLCSDNTACTVIYNVGPFRFRDSLLRIDLKMEVQAPAGKGINWISDAEWHAARIAEGQPGERIVSSSGASYPLTGVGGVASLTNPMLRAGLYTGYWDFAINERPGATLTFEYPNFEIVSIVVP